MEERLGLGGMTVSPMVIARAGLTRSLDLCLTGRMITAVQAVEMCLINRAVPDDKLEAEVHDIATGLTLHPKDGIALGKASRHMIYDTMGITRGLTEHYIMHSFQTNRVYDENEFNFFKQRRDTGVRKAAHDKHDHFKSLDKWSGK